MNGVVVPPERADAGKARPRSLVGRGLLCVRGGVSAAVILYLANVVNWAFLRSALPGIRWRYIAMVPLILVFRLVFATERWHLLLRGLGLRAQRRSLFCAYLVGSFYNIVLPGVIGGDAVRLVVATAHVGQRGWDIAATIFIERVLGVLAVLSIASLALCVAPSQPLVGIGPRLGHLLPVLSIAGLMAVTVSVIAARLVGNYPLGVMRVPCCSPRIKEGLRRFGRLKTTALGGAFGLSLCFQLPDIAAHYVVSRAMGLTVPFAVFLVVVPVVYVATVLPVSLGGLGVREGAVALLLSGAGVDASEAVLFSLLIYLTRAALSLGGGVLHVFWQVPRLSLDSCSTQSDG